jgi:hypothetical protein
MNKSSRLLIAGMVLALAAPAFARLPVRGASANGTNGIATRWNLFGPTKGINFNPNIKMSRQVNCPSQDVEASLGASSVATRAGGCDLGKYLFIFQFSSALTNLTVTMDNLVGFTPNTSNPTYGVLLCDSTDTSPSGNTLERCTTATEPQLPDITATINATNTSISFSIPSIPVFPVGKQYQGRGVTLFVITTQNPAVPIAAPRVSIK